MAKISVIIPAYKAAAFIGRAIKSVIEQEGIEQPEILVIDDCSPDDIKGAVSDFPVTYLRNEKNIGPGPSRNVGIDASSGEYLLFLDADDELGKHQIVTLKNALENNNAGIAYCPSIRNICNMGTIIAPKNPIIHILSGPSIAVPALLLKREACLYFDPKYICEDREWQTRMIINNLKIVFTSDTCYWYHLTGAKERYKYFSEDCAKMRIRLRNWLLSPKGGQATGISMFKLVAVHLRGSIHDSLSKGNLLIPQAKCNIIDAAKLFFRFMDMNEKTEEEDMLLLETFHFYKTGAWRIPEVEAVGSLFSELYTMDEQHTRARLHDFHINELPEKKAMVATVRRELGEHAAYLAETAYTRVRPEDIKKQPSLKITPEMLSRKKMVGPKQ